MINGNSKGGEKIVPVYTMKTTVWVKVQLYSFLTSVLWRMSVFSCVPYPFYPQGNSPSTQWIEGSVIMNTFISNSTYFITHFCINDQVPQFKYFDSSTIQETPVHYRKAKKLHNTQTLQRQTTFHSFSSAQFYKINQSWNIINIRIKIHCETFKFLSSFPTPF